MYTFLFFYDFAFISNVFINFHEYANLIISIYLTATTQPKLSRAVYLQFESGFIQSKPHLICTNNGNNDARPYESVKTPSNLLRTYEDEDQTAITTPMHMLTS